MKLHQYEALAHLQALQYEQYAQQHLHLIQRTW